MHVSLDRRQLSIMHSMPFSVLTPDDRFLMAEWKCNILHWQHLPDVLVSRRCTCCMPKMCLLFCLKGPPKSSVSYVVANEYVKPCKTGAMMHVGGDELPMYSVSGKGLNLLPAETMVAMVDKLFQSRFPCVRREGTLLGEGGYLSWIGDAPPMEKVAWKLSAWQQARLKWPGGAGAINEAAGHALDATV